MKIKPCVIGLGYVGLPLLVELSKTTSAFGYDVNRKRIKTLKSLNDINNEFTKKELIYLKKRNLTHNFKDVKNCNFYIVCVPTPIDRFKKPDISLLKAAFRKLGKIIKKNDIIILESTVFPGTTEDICVPILERESGLKSKYDFFICYSPERINPGDKNHSLKKIVKLISVPNNNCKEKVLSIYKKLSKKIVISNSIKEAELSKVIENIQRDLNIAFMNEVYMYCDKTNLNYANVIRLASTKWNFGKYDAGLVGGHCLPVDPYYFSYIANKNRLKAKVTIAGRDTNEHMAEFLNFKIRKEIKDNKEFKKKTDKIIFAGLTYKKNVSDIRNSMPIKIYKKFQNKNIYAFDPLIEQNKVKNMISENKLKSLKNVKYIIILVYHDVFKKIFGKIDKNIKILKFFKS